MIQFDVLFVCQALVILLHIMVIAKIASPKNRWLFTAMMVALMFETIVFVLFLIGWMGHIDGMLR